MSELKPCPFCGYKHPHLQRQSMAADMCPDETPLNERFLWRIGCGKCGAEINCADTREQVVGIWNIRTTDTELTRLKRQVEVLSNCLVAIKKHSIRHNEDDYIINNAEQALATADRIAKGEV